MDQLQNKRSVSGFKQTKWNVDFTVIFTIAPVLFTALFYASYTAHNQGYLFAFGIDANIMEKSFHKAVYEGMILCYNFGFKTSLLSFLSAMGFIIFIVVYILIIRPLSIFIWDKVKLFIENKRRKVTSKIKNKAKNKLPSPDIPDWLERLSRLLYIGSASAILLLFIFGVVMWRFEANGQKEAETIIKQYKEGKIEDIGDRLVEIKNEKYVDTLLLVDCGSDMCAGINVTGHRVFFNKKKQYKLVSKNPIKQYKK